MESTPLAKRKLAWWQVALFFAGFVGLIVWQVSGREQLNAPDLEDRLLAIQQRACACQGDVACATAARDELAALFVEEEERRISEQQYAFFRSIVEATEGCLSEAGVPSGLALD